MRRSRCPSPRRPPGNRAAAGPGRALLRCRSSRSSRLSSSRASATPPQTTDCRRACIGGVPPRKEQRPLESSVPRGVLLCRYCSSRPQRTLGDCVAGSTAMAAFLLPGLMARTRLPSCTKWKTFVAGASLLAGPGMLVRAMLVRGRWHRGCRRDLVVDGVQSAEHDGAGQVHVDLGHPGRSAAERVHVNRSVVVASEYIIFGVGLDELLRKKSGLSGVTCSGRIVATRPS